VNANAKTCKIYIINPFNYMLRDTTSNWCHDYMSTFPNCIFLELTYVIGRLKMTANIHGAKEHEVRGD
jgi:hypothetical protein